MKLLLEDKESISIKFLTLKELAQKIGREYYLIYSYKDKQLEIRRRN